MTYSEINRNASVMMLTASLHPSPMGGAEIQALKLAKELQKRGLDVFVVTLAQRGQQKEGLIDGIKVFRIKLYFSPFFYAARRAKVKQDIRIEYPIGEQGNFVLKDKKSLLSLLNYFIFFWNVYFYAKRKRVDLIYVPMVEWLAVVATLLGKILNKNVVIKDSTMNGLTNLLRYPWGREMKKFICGRGHFVAMTNIIRASFIEAGIPLDRIFQIPNGVELPSIQKRIVKQNKFIFIGNLSQQPAKGVDVLLKAWRIVMQSLPGAQLFIVGDGNLPAYLEYVDKLGISKNVHFMGKQNQFQGSLAESMAFILPSRREGMSNALLEAMALGVTCIATNISGNQDLIHHGVNGLLIPPEDEFSLAEAVKYVFENQGKAIAMGLEARRTIEKSFTLDIVSENYFNLIRHLMRPA